MLLRTLDGSPAVGVVGDLHPAGERSLLRQTSDASGALVFPRDVACAGMLTLSSPCHGRKHVTLPQEPPPITTVYVHEAGSIDGRVLLPGGEPATGGRVLVWPINRLTSQQLRQQGAAARGLRDLYSAPVDENGLFRVAGLEVDRHYGVTAYGDGYLVDSEREVRGVRPPQRGLEVHAEFAYAVRVALQVDPSFGAVNGALLSLDTPKPKASQHVCFTPPWAPYLRAAILGIKAPWQVDDVVLDREGLEVRVLLSHTGRALAECPECGEKCPGYDTRRRSWRHLDTCQFKTIIEADVPSVSCKKHTVIQSHVPWAEPGSGFTVLMEALVIDWLKEASTNAVAELMGMTWDQVDGIMQRGVKRGLERRTELEPTGICIDETSFQKRHEYVTVVTDFHSGHVLYVGDDRRQSSLDGFWEQLEHPQLAALTIVCMDMHSPYILSVKEYVPFAEGRICFD